MSLVNRKNLLLLLFIPIILYGYLEFWAQRSPLKSSEETVEISLEANEGLTSFSRQLAEKGLISSSFLFRTYVKLRHNYKKFQAGTYQFSLATSPKKLIRMIVTGEIYAPLVLKVTVPEGARLSSIIENLIQMGYSKKSLLELSRDQKFLKNLGISASSLEGYLFPSTYSFFYNRPTVSEIYQAMVSKFFSHFSTKYSADLKKEGFSLHQGVIIASLIEKETSLLIEKPLIAETIRNRLQKRMRLGIDASIIYGIDNFKGDLTRADLLNKKNRYNTRVHYGLPPGPICSPSLSSFQALLNPSSKGYFYYVLKPGKNQKEHHFSQTFAEHKVYVQRLKKSQILQ